MNDSPNINPRLNIDRGIVSLLTSDLTQATQKAIAEATTPEETQEAIVMAVEGGFLRAIDVFRGLFDAFEVAPNGCKVGQFEQFLVITREETL